MRAVHRILGALAVLIACAVAAAPAAAQWPTYHADAALSGVDQSSGAPVPFAPAWKTPTLAGDMWAEPLDYDGLVIVATESNDLYAFNELSGAQVWHVNLGLPVASSRLPCGDISPTVGITSTPTIDTATGTLYAVADQASGSSAVHTLFALNARTGAVLFSRSVEPPGDIPLNQLQRESLTLDQGRVLIGYGGNDGDCAQYWGFLISAPQNNSGSNDSYRVPTSREGAIWSGGGAPAIDSAGSAYVATGNAANGPGQPFDHGDTLEKLSATAGELDYWAPATWAQDSASDADPGSVSPELVSGGMIYQGGKNGNGYLVSAASLGHIGGQLYSAPVCDSFGSDAYADGILFVACSNGIRALAVNAVTHRFSHLWSGPAGANGPPILAGGRIWVAATHDGTLYGLNPLTGAVEITQSTPAMEHFVTPAASDGKLFLATGQTVEAYTIATATPASSPPPPVSKPPSVCAKGVVLHLRIPQRTRIVAVSVYRGAKRLAHRRGRRLRTVTLRRLSTGKLTLRLLETPHRGRRITLRVGVSSCRVKKPA